MTLKQRVLELLNSTSCEMTVVDNGTNTITVGYIGVHLVNVILEDDQTITIIEFLGECEQQNTTNYTKLDDFRFKQCIEELVDYYYDALI